jgi:hypothetical protein
VSGSTSRQSSGLTSASESRRDSKDTSAEGDEGELLKTLIEACDVSKTYVAFAWNNDQLTIQSSQHRTSAAIRLGGYRDTVS